MQSLPSHEGAPPNQPLLHIFLLGHMRVLSSTGLSLLPTGTKTKALLAILALSNRRPVARTRLAELLWSTRAPEQARASLRQEIHRLMEVLHPLGPEVLDVQRHTLAIRPGLTEIDMEYVLHTTPQTVMTLPDPLPPLLEDLSAVDPGFAVWLEQERNRLLDYKTAQLEALLASAPPPAIIMAAAQRLLRLNPLNEEAWRTRILTALHNGEEGTALQSAESCLRTFQDTLATTPGQETMRLIADLRAAHHHARQGAPFTTLADQPPPPSSASAGMYEASSSLTLSATVFLACTPTAGAGDGMALAMQFRNELGLDMAMHGVLDVSVQNEQFAAGPSQSLPARRQWDFLIGITVTGSTATSLTCIVQALDTRLNDTIVWGHRLTITATNLRALANRFASVLIISLFTTEARRLANRPIAALSPLGLGLRAFSLSLQNNPAHSQTIDQLLDEASRRAPENQFLFFVRAHTMLLRMSEEWQTPVAEYLRPMVTMLQQNLAVFPNNMATRYLLVVGLFYTRQPEEARFLLAQMHAALPSDSHTSMLALQDGLSALCRGDATLAARIYADFFGLDADVPLVNAPDQEFILACFLANQHEDALRHARGILASSPDRSAILIPALASANALGHQSLALDYRQRLHRLQTPLSVPCGNIKRPTPRMDQHSQTKQTLGGQGWTGYEGEQDHLCRQPDLTSFLPGGPGKTDTHVPRSHNNAMLRRLMPSHAAASRPQPALLLKGMATATALAGFSLLSACSMFDSGNRSGLAAPNNHLLSEDRGASGGEASLKGGVNAYLWRATLDTLSFMPVATADAEGGIILTDWYTPPATHDERFKITAFVLDRRLRSDALRLSVFRQIKQDGTWVDTPPAPNTASDIATRILSRARKLRADNGNQD